MKESKNKRKNTLLGRNLFTLCIIVPITLILILGIFIIISYISIYNSNKITPFLDKTTTEEFTASDYEIETIERMKLKDFEEYGVIFNCTSYIEEQNKAEFELRVYKNENSNDIIEQMTANVCVSSNWIGFVAYGSKYSGLRLASDKATAEQSTAYRRTFSVTIPAETFPSKANTWPVKVTVHTPTFYIYLEWDHYVDGKVTTEAYVLEVEYSECTPLVGGVSSSTAE